MTAKRIRRRLILTRVDVEKIVDAYNEGKNKIRGLPTIQVEVEFFEDGEFAFVIG